MRIALSLLISAFGCTAVDDHPRILSCIAGLYRCTGVPNIEDAKQWGCPVENITACDGTVAEKTCAPARLTPMVVHAVLGCSNGTSQDATPTTFNWPVDTSTVKAEYFVWTLADGTKSTAGCAVRGGQPAGEDNELQTIAYLGNAGGWGNPATALEIVGDLMLVAPNGTKVSAKGLRYAGPALDFRSGIELLTATFEKFSTQGETLHNPLVGAHAFPNHCHVNFPDTTHRIQLLFDGGCTLDGIRPITPDRTDLVEVRDAAGKALDSSIVLGLADLGNKAAPTKQCDKNVYVEDGDNYLDVCLKMPPGAVTPASVHLPCGPTSQISTPKGLPPFGAACKAQTVNITVA